MSRKYRVERDKLSHWNTEVQEELDRVKLQREKIYGPIIWRTLPDLGIQIQDCRNNHFEESLKLIKDNYLESDLLCRNVQLTKDPESVESFLEIILFNLKFQQSIIAVDQETKEIVGIQMLKTVQKNDFGRIFSRVQMMKGEALKLMMKFLGLMTRKSDVFDYFKVDTYLDYILLCVKNTHRHQGLGYQMMLCGYDVARLQKCPIIHGIFKTHAHQKLAEKMGMKIFYKMSYLDWKDEDGEYIFPEPGAGNYFCAVMGAEVPPPSPPPPPPVETDQLTGGIRLSRVQKLAILARDNAKSKKKKSILNPSKN